MSVPKGDRTPTDKRFLTGEALKLLCSHTIRITQNEKHFPKRSRWIITGPIVKAAVNAYRHASAANGIEIQTWEDYKARRDHQVKTRAHLESLLSLIEIAEETLSLESEKGIGLGSQVSQLIELAVLDPIDHWIKERQGIRHYVRYMDDFILISHDREKLRETMRGIRERVEALGLSLNGKTQIYPLRQGIRFLQWRYVLTDTGKVIRKMSRRSQTRERRKLKRIAEKIRAGQMEEKDLHESFQSWRAHAMRGNSHKAIRRMTRLYDQLKGEIEMEKNILVSLEERMTRATARMEAAADRLEKLAAEQDYIAMMADVDIPTEDEAEEDMEGMENE